MRSKMVDRPVAELSVIRREVRLSQVELVTLSGVSRRTVALDELDDTILHAATLRRTADGLASSGAARLDRAAAAEYFSGPARAAGFAPGDVSRLSDDEVHDLLEQDVRERNAHRPVHAYQTVGGCGPGSKRMILTVVEEVLARRQPARRH